LEEPVKMVAFSVSDEEKQSIDSYAKIKHFGDSSHLARVAIFVYMERNRVGSPPDAGAPARPAAGANSDGGTE
jgi:hypothetical protein